jgi:hypothetical protein
VATVAVKYGELVVASERIEGMWAFACRLEIALAQVHRALLPALAADDPAWRRAGPVSGVAVLRAGAFRQRHGTLYWDVQDPTRAVAIELIDAPYARLVIEAEDPAAVVELINRALAAQP